MPMIRHSMDVIKKATEYLNPGQVPVIAVDQPLFTVAKQIQWNWPESHGEQHFVFILGGLLIEMAALSVLGNWLEDRRGFHRPMRAFSMVDLQYRSVFSHRH